MLPPLSIRLLTGVVERLRLCRPGDASSPWSAQICSAAHEDEGHRTIRLPARTRVYVTGSVSAAFLSARVAEVHVDDGSGGAARTILWLPSAVRALPGASAAAREVGMPEVGDHVRAVGVLLARRYDPVAIVRVDGWGAFWVFPEDVAPRPG
jgi:hypothetical protein